MEQSPHLPKALLGEVLLGLLEVSLDSWASQPHAEVRTERMHGVRPALS